MSQRRAAADHRAVDIPRRDAQVLAYQQRIGAVVPMGEYAVDVGQRQPGIEQGVAGRPALQ